jgi:hypothetical protein
MVRYRVTYKTEAEFGCNFNGVQIIESDNPMSRKEIASQLKIDIDSIINIEVI